MDNTLRNDDTPMAVKITDLHKSYGQFEVIKGVSLEAKKGDVISLIGSSGSGKSTLLRCINFLEQPTSGTIEIAGEKILTKCKKNQMFPADQRQIERIRSRLSMVFQNFNLWQHKTVMDNLIEAPTQVLGKSKQEAKEYAAEILAKVGLYDKRDQFPDFLSGGQQQRVAIARALCVDPVVMLFDEPTSALDPELVGEVLKVIQDLAEEGRTMILVTHEMKFARNVSSQVVYLHAGVIEEQGPPEVVFNSPKSERFRDFISNIH